jgi:hypothetical protein
VIYTTQKGKVSSGEAIGILLLETSVPFIPGDVANATTYSFPVRFRKVEGFSVRRALSKDSSVYENLLEGARDLVQQGVRAVTGDCGFMGIHQKKLAGELGVPVFLSSLLQIPFISLLIGENAKVGIITADSKSLSTDLLEAVGVSDPTNLVISGLEDSQQFYQFAIEETGSLDAGAVEKEVVSVARRMVAESPQVRAILLECSLLPPYGAAVLLAVVKQRYVGFI